MRLALGLALAVTAIGSARFARVAAVERRDVERVEPRPYAPAPPAAPFISLGYREAAADLFYVRLLGHFMDDRSSGSGVADVAEAVVALDPRFRRVYEQGAIAMTLAHEGVDRAIYLRAVDLLHAGMKAFPDDWKLPYLAGQILSQDLKTDDPRQRQEWDERAALLVESAIRKPGAPASAAAWAALMRTKLGQHERAVSGLREMLLVSNDKKARARLLAALATLEARDARELEAEILASRIEFEQRWRRERRTVPATMFILLGPRLERGFDMVDLATGGRELMVQEAQGQLEPLE